MCAIFSLCCSHFLPTVPLKFNVLHFPLPIHQFGLKSAFSQHLSLTSYVIWSVQRQHSQTSLPPHSLAGGWGGGGHILLPDRQTLFSYITSFYFTVLHKRTSQSCAHLLRIKNHIILLNSFFINREFFFIANFTVFFAQKMAKTKETENFIRKVLGIEWCKFVEISKTFQVSGMISKPPILWVSYIFHSLL
jgi:hypothetical protein